MASQRVHLSAAEGADQLPPCPICSGSRQLAFRSKVLGKYEAQYWFCNSCGFLQTEAPYWQEEAYTTAIADIDTGLISRNIAISKPLASLLFFLLGKKGTYLDVAGGFGMLTRLMRDIGFDYYWSDRYCTNLFAKGFDASQERAPYSAVTAFEALEHVWDPVKFVQEALANAGATTIIFSTELFEGDPPSPESWWYYAPSEGQHISFFQRTTLYRLANRLGLRLYTHRNLHMLTDRRIPELMFRLLASRVAVPLHSYVKRKMDSRTFADHDALIEFKQAAQSHARER